MCVRVVGVEVGVRVWFFLVGGLLEGPEEAKEGVLYQVLLVSAEAVV